MSYSQQNGDLFGAIHSLDAIGHGCNCQGAMGAGIAVAFKKMWPDMYKAYNKACREGSFELGGFMPWQDKKNELVIYNLATQPIPRPTATLQSISESVTGMLEDAEKRGIKTIGIPRIGAGLGGLEWPKVEQILRAAADTSSVHLIVFVL